MDNNAILTPSDLSQRWDVTVRHLANMRSAKVGPSYLKLGGKVLYRLSDVVEYENRSVVAVPA